jgi:hypothetical protein
LYRGSENEFSSSKFHDLCDDKGETLCLFESTIGYIFGGYASIPWKSEGGLKKAEKSFIFSLKHMTKH